MKKLLSTFAVLFMVRVFVSAGTPPPNAPVWERFLNTDLYQVYNSILLLTPGVIPSRQPSTYNFYNNDLFQIYNAMLHLDSVVRVVGNGATSDTLYIRTNGYGSTYTPNNVGINNETWLGYNAGGLGESKAHTISIGYQAGSKDTGADYSVYIGYGAGYLSTYTNNNVGIGQGAGEQAEYANNSNFIGTASGYLATNANESNFFGKQAGDGATNAARSNFMGYGAGYVATNAANSIFIGNQAGQGDSVNNITGSHSILIGDSSNTGGFSSSMALGTGAINTAPSQILFSDYYTSLHLLLDTGAPGYVLTTNGAGNASWQTPSGSGWGLTGNAGTNPTTNFLGAIGTDMNIKTSPANNLYISDSLAHLTAGYFTNLISGVKAFNIISQDTSIITGYLLDSANGFNGDRNNGLFAVNPNTGEFLQNIEFHDGISHELGIIIKRGNLGGGEMQGITLRSDGVGLGDNSTNHIDLNIKNDTITIDSPAVLKIHDGTEGVGKSLISDADGNASWQTPTGGNDTTKWSLTGNAGTNPLTDFLGTTDGAKFIISSGKLDTFSTVTTSIMMQHANDSTSALMISQTVDSLNNFRENILCGFGFVQIASANFAGDTNAVFSIGKDNVTIGFVPANTTPFTVYPMGVKIVDGTQGAGKVLTSDASGNASWQAPGNYPAYPNNAAAVAVLGTLKLYVTDGTDGTVAGGLKGLVMQTY